jgi:hypothetical protein
LETVYEIAVRTGYADRISMVPVNDSSSSSNARVADGHRTRISGFRNKGHLGQIGIIVGIELFVIVRNLPFAG